MQRNTSITLYRVETCISNLCLGAVLDQMYATKIQLTDRLMSLFPAPFAPVYKTVSYSKNGHLRSKTSAALSLMRLILFSSDMTSAVGKDDAKTEKDVAYHTDFNAYTLLYIHNTYTVYVYIYIGLQQMRR